MKKIVVNEIISDDGNPISKQNTQPQNALSNNNGSTRPADYNVTVGRQAYASDYLLGMLGFNFFESKGESDRIIGLIEKIAECEFNQYKKHVKHFLDNLNKEEIKKYKAVLSKDFSDLTDEEKKSDYKYAVETLKAIKSYLNKNVDDKERIEEVDDFISKKDKKTGFIKKNEEKEDKEKYEKLDNILDKLIKQIKTSGDLKHISDYIFSNVDSEVINITTKNAIVKNLNNIVEEYET